MASELSHRWEACDYSLREGRHCISLGQGTLTDKFCLQEVVLNRNFKATEANRRRGSGTKEKVS
jgi:hypothetical protein